MEAATEAPTPVAVFGAGVAAAMAEVEATAAGAMAEAAAEMVEEAEAEIERVATPAAEPGPVAVPALGLVHLAARQTAAEGATHCRERVAG